MYELILIDNDIALKVCAYDCAQELMSLEFDKNHKLAMLRVAQYAVDRRVKRARGVQNGAVLQAQWDFLSASVQWIEPSAEEIGFAADLEEQAIKLSLELDGGESQLFAILVYRLSPLLITGDKRAIHALELIGHFLPKERVACLEQVICTFLGRIGRETLRKRICREPDVDRSLSIVFACRSQRDTNSDSSIEEGLMSYISSVQKSAPTILVRATDLSTIVS